MTGQGNLRICVVGAGAVGGVLAYRLAASGESVSVFARGATLQALRDHGLRLFDARLNSELEAMHLAASESPADPGVCDLIFLALKAFAIPDVLPRLVPMIGPDTIVVPAINGAPWWYFESQPGELAGWIPDSLDPRKRLRDVLDPKQIVGCVVHFAAQQLAPGHVQHTNGDRLVIGEVDGASSDRIKTLSSMLQRAGFEVEVSAEIRAAVWWKLLGNLSFNPIATLHPMLLHEICEDEALCAVIRLMIEEGMAIGRALDIRIDGTADQRIDVARKLRGAKTSMQQDFEARRRLELDALLKAPIEIAQRLSIDVPTLRHVDAQVTAHARKHGVYP